MESGIVAATRAAARKLGRSRRVSASGKMRNIPKTHLSYYARIWEGTTGDRVLNSTGAKEAGLAFLEVAPNWVAQQKPKLSPKTVEALGAMKAKLRDGGFPMPNEAIPAYLKRVSED